MRCGLLGRRLGHSYSPAIHALLAPYSYELFEVEPENLEDFLRGGDFAGVNVTIPYKKAVIPYCAALSERARALGAVNTLVRRPDGSLYGHNTDYSGFEAMLAHAGQPVAGRKALVLGSGGASNTVCAVLRAQGAQVVVISRSGADNYGNLPRHADAQILVNATPVGMYPAAGESPVDLRVLPNLEMVLDVIYNPARTRLLLDAEARGLVTGNGLRMLVAQAKESAECFLNAPIAQEKIEEIYQKLRFSMENIVLIGMPGCGKSTIGRLLAAKTGRKFVDVDAEIVREAGCGVPEIFAREGEAGFRRRETAALERLGRESALVLATGGGCVTRPENYPLLHQNGRIFWLRRELSRLPREGRPLSQATPLRQMWRERRPLYAAFADEVVDNNGTAARTAAQILGEKEPET